MSFKFVTKIDIEVKNHTDYLKLLYRIKSQVNSSIERNNTFALNHKSFENNILRLYLFADFIIEEDYFSELSNNAEIISIITSTSSFNENIDINIIKYWNGGILDKVTFEKNTSENLELKEEFFKEILNTEFKKYLVSSN